MIAPTPENKPPTVEEYLALGFGKAETLSTVEPETPIEQNQVIGYAIQRGEKCMVSAKPKCGKSSYLRQAIRMMDLGAIAPWGRDIGNIAKGRVLIVTEESAGTWAEWRDTLDLGDHIDILRKQALRYKPWELICEYAAALVREKHYALVVIDTLAVFAKIKDENNASECTLVLGATDCIINENAALVLIHHDRKSGGSHGDSARGSNALMGCVDTAIQMTFCNKADYDIDRRALHFGRRFHVQSRHDYVLESFALIRDREGLYIRFDDEAAKGPTASEKQQAIIAAMLPEQGTGKRGYDWRMIRENWASSPIPGKATVQKALKAAEDVGLIGQDPSSEGGMSYRYCRLKVSPTGFGTAEMANPKMASRAQEPIEIEKNPIGGDVETRDGYSGNRGNGDRDGDGPVGRLPSFAGVSPNGQDQGGLAAMADYALGVGT